MIHFTIKTKDCLKRAVFCFGTDVLSFNTGNGISDIDVSHLTSGMYFIKASSGTQSIVTKMLKIQ